MSAGRRRAAPRRSTPTPGRPELWRPLVRHDPDERTYVHLHRDDDVELYLICWMPGHDTGFHDHDESAAAIAVLDGAVSEERLAFGGPVEADSPQRASGDHRAARPSTASATPARRPAVTLHAYSPPLDRVGTYEVADDGALLRHPRPASARSRPRPRRAARQVAPVALVTAGQRQH